MPWRVSKKSPKKLYYRLLSEFMLQQTQVKTVIPYFNKFTKKYKTLESLSKINENQILKLWEGLGYYRRARKLLACSKKLIKDYNSKLPKSLEEIKKDTIRKKDTYYIPVDKERINKANNDLRLKRSKPMSNRNTLENCMRLKYVNGKD